MSLGLKVEDFSGFNKLDYLFFLHQSDLEKVLASDLYTEFRGEIDNVISKVKSGTLQEDEGKELESLLSYSVSFLEDNKMKIPYVEIFKYALLFQFNFVSSNVKYESIEDVLKLKELSKMVVLPKIMLKGGDGDDIVPYGERKPSNFKKRAFLFGLTALFGIFSGIAFNSTVNQYNTMVAGHIAEFGEAASGHMGEALGKVLPPDSRAFAGYYEMFPEPYEVYEEAKEDAEDKLLALPAPDSRKNTPLAIAAAAEMEVPEDVPYTATEIATFEEIRPIIRARYESNAERFNTAIERIQSKGVSVDYLSLLKGQMPAGLEEEVKTLYEGAMTEFGQIFQGVASDLQDRVVEANKISQYRRRGVLMNEALAKAQESEGWLAPITNTISGFFKTIGQMEATTMNKVSRDIEAMVETTLTESDIKYKETDLARITYLKRMARLISDETEGIRMDIQGVVWQAGMSTLLILLTINLTLLQIFGPRNRISPIILGAISLLLSQSTTMGVLHAGIQLGVISMAEWVSLTTAAVEGSEYEQPIQTTRRRRGSVAGLGGGKKNKTIKHKKQKRRKHKKTTKGKKNKKTPKQRKSIKGKKNKTIKHKKSRK